MTGSATSSGDGPAAAPDEDGYATTAPFLDLFMAGAWAEVGPALVDALGDLDPGAGPLVDLGAGSGRATLVVAEAHPDMDVWAVEPSASLRSIMLAHLALRPALLERVTVLDAEAATLAWPPTMVGLVAAHMIGHLDPSARAELWTTIAERLAPGASAVIGLQYPPQPVAIAPTEHTAVRVGRHRYEGAMAAEVTGPYTMAWTMTYRVRDGDDLLVEVVNQFDWWTVSPDQLASEAAAAGLNCAPAAAGLHILRHR